MNKSTVILCSLAMAAFSGSAYADALGAKVGIDYFYSELDVNGVTLNDNQDNYRAYAAFEHFIPLIPNGLLEYLTHGSDATGFEQLSATGYYQLLDNNLVSLDLGAGISRYSKFTAVTGLDSENTAHAYVASELALPLNFSLFADGKLFGLQDVSGEEIALGLRWSTDMAIDLGVRFGYSVSDLTFDDVAGRDIDVKSKGWLLGVDARF
ncbi:MAG: TIGR04219 family outer membrane beta-barrel protein [Oceanisphaera sp.]|uniref:TIGR04219 family outer membrane beta-barrel protein n=1 Tax=Oceanisphaera sp. TaxID=1929979 RepID=UPI003F9B7F72